MIDRLRRRRYLLAYELWLDLYGTRRGQRRELTRALRANLDDAAAREGTAAALRGLGPARRLASDEAAALRDRRRPAWAVGSAAAGMTAIALLLVGLLSTVAFIDGVNARSGGGSASGGLTLLPFSEVSVDRANGGLAVGLSGQPLPYLALLLVVFLVASRSWRVLRAARSRPTEDR
ncbi:hypothetical protein PZ938_12450 [Luteipulveratus sp. YIM 133132]|uniref:Uncharacterized protein n=1 Tax=Luteipulveratus flavus TaxID=3031728 RepID=A0ABT6CAJ3_9MICO|nr:MULTISPECIES: hypothetical protein [unclassified Luteipulveratus]MDE9366414.1 hypothetical protein [Luteipulveratus sp. YIM 133132]MDF8264311.1 hypothetical protein [Luteipulveratus sp. YIM 133296]